MEKTINSIIQKAKKKIQHLDTERILCYTIDSDSKIISGRTVSRNNAKGYSYLDVHKFLNMLYADNVFSVVVLHNHPRSTMMTSDDDDTMTERIMQMCNDRGAILYDHIMIMKDLDCVYSYREENKIISILT